MYELTRNRKFIITSNEKRINKVLKINIYVVPAKYQYQLRRLLGD